jgi:hypothetical protein
MASKNNTEAEKKISALIAMNLARKPQRLSSRVLLMEREPLVGVATKALGTRMNKVKAEKREKSLRGGKKTIRDYWGSMKRRRTFRNGGIEKAINGELLSLKS